MKPLEKAAMCYSTPQNVPKRNSFPKLFRMIYINTEHAFQMIRVHTDYCDLAAVAYRFNLASIMGNHRYTKV